MKKFGICRLSVIPVRKDKCDKSEMTTQLLFGEHYKVVAQDGNWIQTVNHFDKYTGWIHKKQHKEISEEYYNIVSGAKQKICTDITAKAIYKKRTITLLIGSVLPTSGIDHSEHEQIPFDGGFKEEALKMDFDYLKPIALKYYNAPYLWGGKTPFGIDCSGFSQIVFKICGHALKRDAAAQFEQGEKVSSIKDARPGDLAFFSTENSAISHVGIILEDSKIIHSSGSVKIDTLNEDGIFNDTLKTITHKIEGVRRILP